MTIFTAPPREDPPNFAGTTPLYISIRSIMSRGMSLRSMKSDCSVSGSSSIKNPTRLPSSPRREMRDELPTPPDARMAMPVVLASTLSMSPAAPCSWCMLTTDTGMACSRSLRALLLPTTRTSCMALSSGLSCTTTFFLSLLTVTLIFCVS